jgi:3-oxoacyl-[acyl-carrier protein] reductase
VVITGRRPDALASAAAELGVDHVVGDLSRPEGLLDEVESRVGGLDVLILNAGGPRPGRILSVDDAGWRDGADLLLLGPLALARAAMPRMAARGFGRVVFVTSTAVHRPEPDLAVSVVLRSAVTAAAKLLSREHAADGVTVNCVEPGATATARRSEILNARAAATGASAESLERAESAAIPAGRPGQPSEVADAIAFLASPAAAYINGTVLTVDGGRTEAIW